MRVLLLLRRRTDAAALPIQLGYTAPRLLPGTTPFSEIRSQDTGSSGPSLLVVAAAVWAAAGAVLHAVVGVPSLLASVTELQE